MTNIAGVLSFTLVGLTTLLGCGSDSTMSSSSSSSSSGSSSGSTSSSQTSSPPDCPGIPKRFGGPQPEGAVICHDNASVDVCKNGQWVSAGVSCAGSTTKDSAGVVHACQCSTDYGRWSARCWYENSTCMMVNAGGGAPCEGKPAGAVCSGNWLYDCDGSGNATGNTYCANGCAEGKCGGNDPCVNATGGMGSFCGSTLSTAGSKSLFQAVSADANTLYKCSGYVTQSSAPCANGCQAAPGGDACK